MLKIFNYLSHNSTSNKQIKKEDLFEGEKIMYKLEDIKLEDE
jgi:hypothetical protein